MRVFKLPKVRIQDYVFQTYLNPLLNLANRKRKANKDLTVQDLLPVNPEYSIKAYQGHNPEQYKTSIVWQLIKAIGLPFYVLMAIHILTLLMTYVMPTINKKLIKNLEENNPDKLKFNLLLVFALFVILLIQHAINRIQSEAAARVRTKTNSILFSVVINKTLKLSSTEIDKLGQGKILSFLGSRRRITMYISRLGSLWSEPFRALLSLSLVVAEVGWIFLPSLAFVLLSFGVSWLLTRNVKRTVRRREEHRKSLSKRATEIIKGIKAIKTNALETHAGDICSNEFEAAQKHERKERLLTEVDDGQKEVFTNVLILAAFLAILWKDPASFTLSKVFTIMTLYGSLRMPLFSIQRRWLEYVNAQTYFKEFEDFLGLAEKKVPIASKEDPTGIIRFEGAQIACIDKGSSAPRTLFEEINLVINPGDFLAIVGPIGVGKSLFLRAILNESMIQKGQVVAKGNIMYLPHDAWIINETLQTNIIMDQPFDKEKYEKILDLCQLTEDITLLPKGDQTLIGSRGINLSGGQRQRVVLARSLYLNGDIFLFDDSICQLDPAVASNILHKVFKEYLKGKTRVFVTSNISWLSEVSRVIILEDGKIAADGPYEQLHKTSSSFINFEASASPKQAESRRGKVVVRSKRSGEESEKIVADEVKVEQKFDWKVVKELFSYSQLWHISLFIFFMFLNIWLSSLQEQWPFLWCADAFKKSNEFYAISFLLIMAGKIISNIIYNQIRKLFEGSLLGKVYQKLLNRVLNAPLSWHDVTESGVIITKLTQDFHGIFAALYTLINLIREFGELALSLYISIQYMPEFAIPMISLGILTYHLTGLSVSLLNGLDRLYDNSRDRLITRYQEFFDGIFVIHSRGQSTVDWMKDYIFTESHKGMLIRALYMVTTLWHNTRRRLYSRLVMFYIFSISFFKQDVLSPVATVIVINGLIKNIDLLEGIFSTIERVYKKLEVCKRIFTFMEEIPQERDPAAPGPKGWPKNNNVSIKNLSLRYGESLPYIIKNLSLEIEATEKVGIAGRTGCGKSTLLLGLVRLLEACLSPNPSIEIGGEDIEKIGLRKLRERVIMIPQEPWLFSGTIRHNMDPEGKLKDEEILELFDKVGIKSVLENKLEKTEDSVLNIELSENGGNLSQGEKQLLCIVRALIRKPSVLIMDEATANLDEVSDQALQKYIKEEMKSTTVLVVAHRKNSLAMCSRIIDLSGDKS